MYTSNVSNHGSTQIYKLHVSTLLQKWQRFVRKKKREDTTEGTFFVLIRNAIRHNLQKKPQTSANQFLEETQAYSNQTQCVKKCQYYCIRDESPRSIKENRELAFEIMFMFYR